MPRDYILTKSKYCTGLQCLRWLWKEVNAPDEMPETDPATDLLFKQGRKVNEAARDMFPEGVLIKFTPWDTIVDRTKNVIEEGAPIIFEGTFIYDETMVRVDILKKVGDNLFDIIEVKMSTKVKNEHLPDVAVQRYVLEGNGLGIDKTYIMHLNSGYIHPGQGDLFLTKDYTEEVNEHLRKVAHKLQIQKDALRESEPPELDIGPHCKDPHDCPLKDECWGYIPKISILNIPGFRWDKRWDLFQFGIIFLKELPPKYSLNAKQKKFVHSAKTKEPVVDKDAIKREMDSLKEPIYFMDFETMNWALPRYDGCNPYYQVPFQWSLHILKNGKLKHKEFITETAEDPREEFTKNLIKNIGNDGPVIVYHQGFEKVILNKLAEALPKQEPRIRAIISRLWDLENIFKYHYMDAQFLGSTSLKNVLPIVVPELSYDDLEIGDGSSAQAAYVKMIESEGEEKEKLKEALLEYCKMDTMAMVEMYKRIKDLTIL